MQNDSRYSPKHLTAALAATGFALALLLSATVQAQHGGNVSASGANRSATPTYDAWLAESKTAPAPARQEAALESVMTDSSPLATDDYAVPTTPRNYGQFFRFGR